MTERQKLEEFLATHNLNYTIPSDIRDDSSIFESIHAVCQELISTKPALLSSANLQNLDTLMHVAQDASFFTGTYNGRHQSCRPFYFKLAINLLFNQTPCVLNQMTFDAICRITTANLDETDIGDMAQNFVFMQTSGLLNSKNIEQLTNNVINAPLRQMVAQQMMTHSGESVEGSTLFETSRARKLRIWLQKYPWVRQTDFDLMMCNKTDVFTLAAYMKLLHNKAMNTTANCQALIDIDAHARTTLQIYTQKQFNADILRICDEQLALLNPANLVTHNPDDKGNAIQQHFSSLYKKLCEIRKNKETEIDPRNFLHTLVTIRNALPTQNNIPTKDAINELIAIGQVAKDAPSSQWRSLGLIMMLFGSAIAIAAGIVLTVGSAGISSPVGMGIAAVGTLGAVKALTGIGVFQYSRTRADLSKNIMDFAEAIPQPLSP